MSLCLFLAYISPMPGGMPPQGGQPAPDLLEAITSSILRIMDATSVADLIICSFTLSGSTISSLDISTTFALLASIPLHLDPFVCLDRSSVSVSIGSIPAFSANASGITSRDSANLSAANCSLPDNVEDHSLSFPAT